MPNFNQAIATNKAITLITDILAGKTRIEFTHAVASSKDYSNLNDDQLANLTQIDEVGQDIQINEVNRINKDKESSVVIPLSFENTEVQNDFMIYTIGIYARELNGDEVLYSVMTAKTPQLQPAYDGSSPTTFKMNAQTLVGKASNVNVVVNPMNSVTLDQLNSELTNYVKINDLESLIAEKIPTTLADTAKQESISEAWDFEKTPTVNTVSVATKNDLNSYVSKGDLANELPSGIVTQDSLSKDIDTVINKDTSQMASKAYVDSVFNGIKVPGIPDTIADIAKDENITGSWDFIAITISGKHVATEPYVDNKVSGLASQDYVNGKVTGLATESYVNGKVTGLATETYVNSKVNGLATESYVTGKVSDSTATKSFNGDWNTLKSNGTYYSVSGTNLPPVSAYWLLRVIANGDGSRVEQIAFQDNGDAVWIRHLNSSWSSWIQLVDKKYVDNQIQSVKDEMTTKLSKLNFSYGNLTVDNDPVVPIVMVADEDTAKSQDASKPHTQHEWSDD